MKELLEYSNQNLGGNDIKEICDSLQSGELRILSLRKCMLFDQDFKRLMKWVGQSSSILQLSLNVGVIGDNCRVQLLAKALRKNRSLTTLFLHGNTIGDDGMKLLCPIISKHPHIVSLDVGDCQLGDLAVEIIASDLVQSRGAKPGLYELGLCYNHAVTTEGWARLGLAVASSSCNLRQLYVDYNQIGETAVTCLFVGLVARNGLEVLDLEGAGITEENAHLLHHILQNYDISLKKINLAENDISSTLLEAIKRCIQECENRSTSSMSREQLSLAQSEPPLIDSETEDRHMINLKSPETMSARLGDLEVENIENDEKMKTTGDSKITTMTDEDILILARALESQDKEKDSPESSVEGTNSLEISEKSCEFIADLEDSSKDTDWEELQIVKSNGRGGRLLMVRQSASTVSVTEDIDDMTEELANIQSTDMGDHGSVSSYHPSTTQSFHSLRNSQLSLM